MEIIQRLAVNNECYKVGGKLSPTGLMLHSTGANNPNLGRYVHGGAPLSVNTAGNHWNTARPDGRQVCVHGFIGKLASGEIGAVQTLPWTMKGWHCGGAANNTHIGIEICEDNLGSQSYFNSVYAAAVEVFAALCKQYDIPASRCICHSEGHAMGLASNHADVMHWFKKYGKTMDTFRADVAKCLTPATKLYRVRKSPSDATSQIGAYSNLTNAIAACNAANPFAIYDELGTKVYPV